MLDHVEENAPLRRSVSIDEVGNVAAFLCSDLASGVTGEITYVDSGYNILGMTGLAERRRQEEDRRTAPGSPFA